MTRLSTILPAVGALALTWSSAAFPQSTSDRAWLLPDAQLVIDPYEANSINWDQLAQDKAVKAVLHRAYHGWTKDAKFEERTAEAKRRGYSVGLYLLGKPGDPIAQADLLVAAGERTEVKLLALDIENMNPASSMTLADAERFIDRVHEKTGRYPLFYTNFSTYQHISTNYGASSAFAKTRLWIARFREHHGLDSTRIWPDYTLWQFQSELNCAGTQSCYHRVPGTRPDMDVNVFRGSEVELRAFFDGR